MPSDLLSLDDVADYLGVPAKSILEWHYRHDGPPAFKLGRYLKWREADVLAWLESKRLDR